MKIEICKGNYEKPGVERQGDIITFTVWNVEQKECELVLYPRNKEKPRHIPMQAGTLDTAVYSVGLRNFNPQEFDYNFEIDGTIRPDPFAKRITGREKWANNHQENREIKSSFYFETYVWRGDKLPKIPKEDMVMYKLHVRGFSMGMPKETKDKGTIAALERKIRYFKELGVTTLELMPIYEFEEIIALMKERNEICPPDKINYWGYTLGNYFAPKAAYLGEGNDTSKLKQFIAKLHRNQMECVLEFHFDKKLNPLFSLEVLRYWAREYHVDGFHLLCDASVAHLAAQDVYLSGRKLFFEHFPDEILDKGCHAMELFSYNDAFTYAVRKLMNRQDGNLGDFTGQMRRQHEQQGFINYIASNNGFALYDLFTYSQKYNQANGEENLDGIDRNYSSNCGEEGPSRKKRVNEFRIRQIKNALAAVFFSQGIPLLWMGDEDGNTQQGNNNAYCQDNAIGWKDWRKDKKAKEIRDFVKLMSAIRKSYPILHNPLPMRMEDYNRVGCPDLSYHGERGWQLDCDINHPLVGMMYCGKYAKRASKEEYLYLGYNFHQTSQQLALPDLPRKMTWSIIMDTGAEETFEKISLSKKNDRTLAIKKQSVCLLLGEEAKNE